MESRDMTYIISIIVFLPEIFSYRQLFAINKERAALPENTLWRSFDVES